MTEKGRDRGRPGFREKGDSRVYLTITQPGWTQRALSNTDGPARRDNSIPGPTFFTTEQPKPLHDRAFMLATHASSTCGYKKPNRYSDDKW